MKPAGDVWVGVVGRNFNPAGPHWNMPFFDESSEKKDLVTACNSSTGVTWKNGTEFSMGQLTTFGDAKGPRIQIEMNSDDRAIVMNVLSPTQEPVASVSLDQLKTEMCVAVCFGPAEGTSSVKLVGSSCEKKEKEGGAGKTNADMWDNANKQDINSKQAGKVPSNELLGGS